MMGMQGRAAPTMATRMVPAVDNTKELLYCNVGSLQEEDARTCDFIKS